MKSRNLFFVFYLVLVTALILLLVEFLSQKVNSANGVKIPMVVGKIGGARFADHDPVDRGGAAGNVWVLDPHLGYAQGENQYVRKLQEKYAWVDGFAVYSKRAPADLQHPIILAMGGSTTDPVKYDHSWPEELSKLLAERGISGTVVNGGTAGYSTNQELLKLVRDGLEFKPDVIISYSGVNDRGAWGKPPYPMVHPYQRYILEVLTRPAYSPLFPNTIYLLSQILQGSGQPARMTATLGVRSSRTLGQQYEKNMILMAAIARASGATFYGIIQPNAYVGPGGSKDREVYADLRSLYAQISDVPARLPFVHSFISIFDGEDGTYIDDGIHATLKGDHIIAEKVLDLIYSDLSGRKTSGAPEQSITVEQQ